MSQFVSAIIVAAGGSVRMGTEDSKQFLPLLGKPAIQYTLTAFEGCGLVNEIIVVCREQDVERIKALAADCGISKLAAAVTGGDSRAESVRNGVSAASPEAKLLAIHDGARPLITVGEIERVIETAFETGAAALGTEVTDTIKLVDDSDLIVSTPQRSRLRAVQTPQVFDRELYTFAMENAEDKLSEFTDDCALIESMGGEVTVVRGEKSNIKLTTPLDIIIAESILSRK